MPSITWRAGFQSTHSLRSATASVTVFLANAIRFQSTHSLRSATHCGRKGYSMTDVSIHALLAECDSVMVSAKSTRDSFNPRTPCGVRHSDIARLWKAVNVSIHALLAECDSFNLAGRVDDRSFNPRTPCGVRLSFNFDVNELTQFQSTHSLRSATISLIVSTSPEGFQSTHSLRSATWFVTRSVCFSEVSIHALLAECDLGMTRKRATMICFNPRTPCGVRPIKQ